MLKTLKNILGLNKGIGTTIILNQNDADDLLCEPLPEYLEL